MRKLILVVAVAVMACGAAFAQKGMQGIGVNIGARYTIVNDFPYSRHSETTDFNGFAVLSIEIKYQYNISNYYRIEPFVSYNYYSDGPEYQVGVNNDIFFYNLRRFRPYFIVGLGYSNLNYCYKDIGQVYSNGHFIGYYVKYEGTDIRSCFYLRGGIGGDYRFSHKWSGQLELCVTGHVSEESMWSLQLLAGVTYNF